MRTRDTRRALELRSSAASRNQKTFALEIRATGEDGTIEGYGSVFNELDAYNDVIAPGAFASSLAAHKSAGTMPAMLWCHDADEPIGVWTAMSEDAKGLKVSGKLALETTRGKEAYALLKLGALNGLSIGFVAKQWAYERESDVRTLTELDLWEVSLVVFPANAKARVTNTKSAADDVAAPKDAERILREAGFSRSDATAFVSRVMRLGEEQREAAHSTVEQATAAAQRLLSSLTNT